MKDNNMKVLKVLVASIVASSTFASSLNANVTPTQASPVKVEAQKKVENSPTLSITGKIGFEGAAIRNAAAHVTETELSGFRVSLSQWFLTGKAEHKTESGFIYSVNGRIFADTSRGVKNTLTDADKELLNATRAKTDPQVKGVDLRPATTLFDRLWLELKHEDYGTLQIGNYLGAYNTMIEDASSILGGNGGFMGGNCFNYYFLPEGLVKEYRQSTDTRVATKVTYYTPRLEGFQLGASYTPRADAYGLDTTNYTNATSSLKPTGQNVIGVGVNFEKEFSGLTLKAGVAGLSGQAVDKEGKADDLNNVFSWEWSLRLTSGPFDIAGGYVDNGTSGLKKVNDPFKDAGKLYDVALSYSIGAAKVAVGTLYTTHTDKDNFNRTLNAYSLTADYTISKGLVAYIDITKLDGATNETAVKAHNADPKNIKDQKAGDNSGYIGFVGLTISF